MVAAGRRALAAAAALGATVGLAACGSNRSVEAYCSVFYGEGQQLRSQWAAAGSSEDPFAGLAAVFSAPRDLAVFFDKLDKVAPEEIEPDVAELRDAFQQQADSLGSQAGGVLDNPLGALAGSLAAGLSTAGVEQRVDDYTLKNCGPPPTD